jgi:hypothetical protein
LLPATGAGLHEEVAIDQLNFIMPMLVGLSRGGTKRMNHLDGICVEYIQALESLQDRVRELRNNLKENSPSIAEVGEQIQEIDTAAHVAWHLLKALGGSYQAAVQAARKRGEG